MPKDSETSNQSDTSNAALGALDFERAEKSSHAASACAQCATPITDRYFTLGSHVLCEPCHLAVRDAAAPGNAATRLLGAATLGAVAAAIGCALWMVVSELTGYEIGLIAIVVGYIVGMAVHIGARRVGGVVYQLLAVFLTYTAIVMTYVPMIANELMASEDFHRGLDSADSEPFADEGSADPSGDPLAGGEDQHRAADAVDTEDSGVPAIEPNERAALAWFAAVPIAYMAPFLMGFENIIGILIIGFALWQAFRMNARAKLVLQGPFRLEARDPTLG